MATARSQVVQTRRRGMVEMGERRRRRRRRRRRTHVRRSRSRMLGMKGRMLSRRSRRKGRKMRMQARLCMTQKMRLKGGMMRRRRSRTRSRARRQYKQGQVAMSMGPAASTNLVAQVSGPHPPPSGTSSEQLRWPAG
jgi:hypothetical protein